jgi:hypothetical protein
MSEEVTESTDAVETEQPVEAEEVAEDKPLGPKGESALYAEKERRKEESVRRRHAESELAELRESLKPAPEEVPDAQALHDAAVAELTKSTNERVKRSEVKSAATGKFADVSDVFKFIDMASIAIDEHGEVNQSDIDDSIDALLASKPYLAASTGTGSPDAGIRKDPSRPSQLTKADISGWSYHDIESARAAGRLDQMRGISTR